MFLKCMKFFLLFFAVFTVFFTGDVKAKEFNINNYVQIAEECDTSDPNSCCSILGNVDDEDSVAWLVQRLLNYIKVLGPSIAVILGSIDFGKAIITSDEENMKKAQVRFIKRIIAAVCLFFVPLFTQILLGLFGITSSNASCGLN